MEKRFEFIDAWNMAATLLVHQSFESNQARVDALADLAVRLYIRYEDFYQQYLEIEAEYEENQSSGDANRLNCLSALRDFLNDIKSKM